MKKITSFLVMLLVVTFGFAQQEVVQDFESSPSIAGFEGLGSATIDADPSTAGNGQVFELVTSTGGNPWQGAEVVLADDSVLDLTSDITISVDVWSDIAFSPMVKVESTQGAPAAANTQNHSGEGWETLTFTFNTESDGTSTANGVYTKVVFFPNRNAADDNWRDPIIDGTFYFDNITGVKTSLGDEPVGNAPENAAPAPPTRNAADVISIFSDAYTDIEVDTYDTDWCPGTTSEIEIGGNATKRITGLGCEGIDWQSARTVDASQMTHFHIDIWTEAETLDKSFNLKFSNWAGGSDEANAVEFSATNASNPALPNPNPGTWISFDIPLSNFTSGDLSDIVQFIITSDLGTVYYDNLYLYSDTPLSNNDFSQIEFNVYPNPAQSQWTIEAGSNTIDQVQVFDLTGRQVLKVSGNEQSKVQLNASSLNAGVYLAKIQAEGTSKSIKLIKK